MDIKTETDIEYLRSAAMILEAELTYERSVNRQLLEIIRANTGELWSQQALKLAEAEQMLVEPAAAPKPEKHEKPRKAKRRSGPRPQPKLPIEDVSCTLSEDERVCGGCGGELAAVEGMADTSELIDVIEVRYVVKRVCQQTYRCCDCGDLSRAKGPARAVKGGRYSLDVGVKVAIDKYEQHVPLARQARIAQGHDLQVGRNALYGLIERMADELEPAWNAILDEIRRHEVIGLDQTGWPDLDQKKKKRWQVWCLTAPGLVGHVIRGDKTAATFDELLNTYQGTVVCDAMSSHLSASRVRAGPIKLAGCWAHVRRKFADAEPDHPRAREALELIRALYDIEAKAQSDDERRTLRASESKAVLARLKAWLSTTAAPRTTSLGAAIRYALNDWGRLTVFADDPQVPLDNNATERGLRGIAIGRRVHFGSKSRRGTQVAAIFYTLIESAKAWGVDARGYLRAAVLAARAGIALTPGGYAAYLGQDEVRVDGADSLAQPPSG